MIRAKQTGRLLPALEAILTGFGRHPTPEGGPQPEAQGRMVIASP